LPENVLEGFAAQKHTVRELRTEPLISCRPNVPTRATVASNAMSQAFSPEEFEALFLKYYPQIVGVLRRIVGDYGCAEDLASEVFLKLYRRPLAQDSDSNVGGWLYRTATNLGIDSLRAAARRNSFEQAAARESNHEKASDNGFDRITRSERAQRVRTVLAEIKPAQAQLLFLRASGDSYKELSAASGIELASVGTLLVRAEVAFEQRYRELFGSEEGV
jgi:RNA polymerase sigma factor (sigma-70 family)